MDRDARDRFAPEGTRIEAVLNRARALGLIDENRANPARSKGHLDQLLPNPKKVGQRRGHHAAMPYADVPAFMATLKAASGAAARALMFAILCAARSGEVFGAKSDEIDLDAGMWTVPPHRMKMARPHRIPHSAPARRHAVGSRCAAFGPSAFAAGSLPSSGSSSISSPVAMRMTLTALPMTSAGRFSPLGPVGIGLIFLRDDVKTRSIQGS